MLSQPRKDRVLQFKYQKEDNPFRENSLYLIILVFLEGKITLNKDWINFNLESIYK